MKKTLCALLIMMLCVPALAELSFDGKVVSSKTLTVMAPFGGIIDEVYPMKGDSIHTGDPVATLQTTRVYAPMDGVIGGIFAKPGDETEGIISQYGGIMYLEPTNRYIITADTEKAYNSSSTRFVHIGEEVYLSCVKDGSHTGTAVVTGVDDLNDNGDTPYKLEVTSGSFYMGETVGIYRTKGFASSSRIGRGIIHQNAARSISGSGSVLRLHVKEGDSVERGQLLFETVEGALDGLYAVDNTILSGVDGIVASVEAAQGGKVEKNGKLITVYPLDAMQVEMYVSEMDLPEVHEGDAVSIVFEWDVDAAMPLEGTISRISRVGADADNASETRYSVFVDFTPVDAVSMDMSAVVHMSDPAEPEDEEEEEIEPDEADDAEADETETERPWERMRGDDSGTERSWEAMDGERPTGERRMRGERRQNDG